MFVLLALLAACGSSGSENALNGRILLWHSWPEEEAAVLDAALQEFTSIHPDATIISTFVPATEIRERYEATAPQGLGPNLLIGRASWASPLAAAGLLSDWESFETTIFNFTAPAVRNLRSGDDNGLYGLPLSVSSRMLFYNRNNTSQAVDTVDSLFAAAESGQTVALPVSFQDAYWGIEAFGEGLFTSDGQFQLRESGLVDWLTRLKDAQEAPNIILSRDPVAVRQLFLQGNATYYIGAATDQEQMQAVLGADVVGVAALPSGPNGSARPLLQGEALMLNPASSAQQTAVATAVAEFLTNEEQATLFMRETGRAPANRQVDVNGRIYPNIAAIAFQSRSAVFLPRAFVLDELSEIGDLAYANVLSGLQTPLEASCAFGRAVIAAYPDDVSPDPLPTNCPPPATEDGS